MSNNFMIIVNPSDSDIPAKKRQIVSNLINKILPYSAMNKKANSPPPYSILNPETSSLSPSAKSNGARLVSAKHLTNHIIKNIGRTSANHKPFCESEISINLNEFDKTRRVIKIKANLTS